MRSRISTNVLAGGVAAFAMIFGGGIAEATPGSTGAPQTANQVVTAAGSATPLGEGCTGVPDSYGPADFLPACAAHDACYSVGSPRSRLDCDNALLHDLTNACVGAYPPGDPAMGNCANTAGAYYKGVRELARSHYEGSGDPA